MRNAKAVALFILACLSAWAGSAPRNGYNVYVATAYAQSGVTSSGVLTQRHIVAADPDLIPIGSRIKIKGAGRYSGEYVVADTGRNIQGPRIDIYMPSERSCVRFGRKRIKVRVIQLGDGTKQTTIAATHEVKKDVQNELNNKAVGSAATQEDWAVKKQAEAKASTATSGGSDVATSRSPQSSPK
jgi:3D (Asp-Asp-Asp) domain-containing protein